ncbi:MAG: ABC-2 transporter permease [Clostridiales bacterium]|nr:ABC-2 transporter permease [Clostridiales bacterium]
MKGLLLKDYYLLTGYCRSFILLITVFVLASCAGNDSFFFTSFPCIFAGILPMTLLSYDDREKWTDYAGTFPYTKAMLVSVKYIMGLFTTLSIFALTVAVQLIRAVVVSDISFFVKSIPLLSVSLTGGLLASAILLPFIFRFGVEKGRIVYYAVICLFSIGISIVSQLSSGMSLQAIARFPAAVIVLLTFLLYGLSWMLSIKIYNRHR